MKAYIMQPPYSRDVTAADALFRWKMDALDKCAEDVDIIVLPEYCDVPVVTATLEETLAIHKKNIGTLLDKCIQTARRCHAMVFVNALSLEKGGYRNTTYCYDREGNLRGKYFKKHLPPLEMEALKLDSDYTMEPSFPYVLEMEGLRFGFMTCYDFYFTRRLPAWRARRWISSSAAPCSAVTATTPSRPCAALLPTTPTPTWSGPPSAFPRMRPSAAPP